MRRRTVHRLPLFALALVVFGACAKGTPTVASQTQTRGTVGDDGDDGDDGSAGAAVTAGSGGSATAGRGGSTNAKGGAGAGGEAAGASASDDGGDDEPALDSALVKPSPNEPACVGTGNTAGCTAGTSCRIFSHDEGRCDGCSGGCAPAGAACQKSSECAITAQCYAGFCRTMCLLTPGTCDEGTCRDVGNLYAGVCTP